MIDVSDPQNPVFDGCYADDGYSHDIECVIYRGPDTRYQGSEICFGYNENTLTIVDISDRSNPVQLSRVTYEGVRYSHQGWLTSDQAWALLDDELDEVLSTDRSVNLYSSLCRRWCCKYKSKSFLQNPCTFAKCGSLIWSCTHYFLSYTLYLFIILYVSNIDLQ